MNEDYILCHIEITDELINIITNVKKYGIFFI